MVMSYHLMQKLSIEPMKNINQKFNLNKQTPKKQACDVDPSFSCTNASQNSTGVLDRVSHHHEITSLGKAYQQEISSDKDKGHQSTDTMDGKSTVGSVCNRASHDESVHVTQLDKSTSTGFLASTLNIAALRLKDKIGIKETDGDSGKSEEDLVPEANVHHKASDLSRKSSGVRFSYLQRLGIQGIKRVKSEEQLPAEHRKELKNDCESKRQEDDQMIPKQDDQMIPKQSVNNPFQSSQPSRKEQQSPISTSSFSFPIPFTSLGPSLPVLKPSSPKSPTKMKTEKKSSEFAIDEKISNLKFDPVPMTAIGPSIPVKSDFKVYDTRTDNTESSEGRMSRSSSSSSFASVTYEDDQQNIPFEEIDLQFASGSSEMLGINDTKESTKMKPLKEADIDKRNEDGLGVNKFEEYISHKPETTPAELPNLLPSGIGMNPVGNSSKRLSWQGDFTFHDKQQGCQSEFEVPKVISSSEAKRQNVLIRVSPDTEIPRPSRPDTKNVAFQPIAPAPSNTISPKKGGNRPVLNRSKTSPSLLSIQGMTKQEVARSEVRLMEAKVGRFHISAVTIPRTEVMKDRSGKEYVLYCIQYEVTAQGVLPMTRSSDGNVAGVVTKIVKRRHREFVNLHCRLDENLKFKQLLKGVRDPPRRMGVGLAFGVVSKTVYEHRRISLQHYLQQLINQPMLGHSEEIAEFLALGGDAHIEFVKKRTDIAPKIDQFLQWAVPSIVSTMKNAVPRAVVDLGTGAQMLSPPGSPKSQRRQKGRDITGALLGTRDGAFSPTPLDNLDMEWVHDNSRLQTRTLTQVQSAAHLFLEDHHDRETEPKADRIQKPYPIKPIDLGPRFEGDGCDATELAEGEATKVPQTLPLEEIELLDKIMALLTEAMHGQGQPSWILDERLQKVVCVVVGKPLDRWIGEQIESLVSEQWCAYYLTLIQDAIWPNGQLIDSTVARTDEEKEHMRKEALQCLIDILPGYLQQVIGQDKWKACMEVMLDSLQDPQLNRHLVYTLLDLLLEAVATEITQHEFQETLLNSNTSLS
ncbi:uncharacterized protein [Amphiura filiformis]|uniref:uncharacterized protein n=1 Tax=Amphiura filiformis TaxID=82378 RepID=UPI003B213F28